MSLNAVLEKLKQQYISELPEKIAHLTELAKAENFTELSKEFHKLKGSGKTYGLEEVSLISEPLEFICKEPNENAATATNTALKLLQKTYDLRSSGKAFEVSSDASFQQIQTLYKAAS